MINNTLQRIQYLLEQKNWSIYRLAKESGIPYSSLNSLFIKNNQPTISTLEKICTGFNISMSEFFSTYPLSVESKTELSKEEIALIQNVRSLSMRNKKLLYDFIAILQKN